MIAHRVIAVVLGLAGHAAGVSAVSGHDESVSAAGVDGGAGFGSGWLDPAAHRHVSPAGAPLVHSFRLEPAFTHRDLLLSYSFRDGPDESEHEIEAEIEYAFTRRIGMIVEVPYLWLDEDGEGSASGFGDLAVAPRLLVAEFDAFLLALNLEVEMPTGDDDRGLGSGEVAVAPSFSAWADLGEQWAFNAQAGVEHGLESSETELMVRASLIRTLGHSGGGGGVPEGEDHGHGRRGLTAFIFEVDSAVGLSGDERGAVHAEGIIGISHGIADDFDIRVGCQFPLSSPREIDGGFIFGLIRHF